MSVDGSIPAILLFSENDLLNLKPHIINSITVVNDPLSRSG